MKQKYMDICITSGESVRNEQAAPSNLLLCKRY